MNVFSKVFPTETCTVKRNIEGHTDKQTGNWVPAGEQVIATVEADIQPKSGRERASSLQTKYESDYEAFIDFEGVLIPVGVLVMLGVAEQEQNVSIKHLVDEYGVHIIQQGDIFTDSYDREYDVVFSKYWTDHYEVELKLRD